jgi:RNA polymerase sigma factor (sigma-70 family)
LEDPSSDLAWTRRLAFRLARDKAASDDIGQDVWLIARRTRPDADRSLRPWLGRVVLNLVRRRHRDSTRRARRELAAEPPEPNLPADQLLERAEMQRLVVRLLGELPESSRQLVLLHYFDGLTSQEIGRRLQVPAGTVRWRLSRAVEELRGKLDREHAGERKRWVGAFLPLFGLRASPPTGPSSGSLAVRRVSRLVRVTPTWVTMVSLGGLLVAGGALWLMRQSGDRVATATADHAAARAVPAVAGTLAPRLRLPILAGVRPPGAEGAGTLEGMVTDAEGHGLPGALVAVFSGNDSDGVPLPRPIRTVAAGPGGRFRVAAIPPGEYLLSAHQTGFSFAYRRPALSLAAGESRAGLTLKLTRGGLQIRGRVADSGGGWIIGAEVTAVGETLWNREGPVPGRPIGFARSDFRGEFSMTLPDARYQLSVEADGYMPGSASADPRTSDQMVHVRLEPGVLLAGRVLQRPTGEAVPGAIVSIENENGYRVVRGAPVLSDNSGRFVLGPVAAGRYRLQASAGPLIARTAGVIPVTMPQAEEILLEVERGSSVQGRVVGPDGRPIGNVDITLAVGNPRFGPIAAQTGPDGRYLIEGLLPGEYFLTARASDSGLMRATKSTSVEDPITTVDFALGRGAVIEGRVLDCHGAAVRGADVEVLPEALTVSWPLRAVSGPNGRFRIAGVPHGLTNARVEVEHGYHGDPLRQTIAIGREKGKLELRLPCAP